MWHKHKPLPVPDCSERNPQYEQINKKITHLVNPVWGCQWCHSRISNEHSNSPGESSKLEIGCRCCFPLTSESRPIRQRDLRNTKHLCQPDQHRLPKHIFRRGHYRGGLPSYLVHPQSLPEEAASHAAFPMTTRSWIAPARDSTLPPLSNCKMSSKNPTH